MAFQEGLRSMEGVILVENMKWNASKSTLHSHEYRNLKHSIFLKAPSRPACIRPKHVRLDLQIMQAEYYLFTCVLQSPANIFRSCPLLHCLRVRLYLFHFFNGQNGFCG